MVREVLPRVHICSLALIVSAFFRASSWTVLAVDCTRFDIAELEDYLSKVHPANLPAIDTMIGKFTSPVTELLPFGALRSDWQRLSLLERAQPEGSILREKLGRLFRILEVAYFQTVEPSDITEQPVFLTTGSWDGSTGESAINFEEDHEGAEKLDAPATDSTETNQISKSSTSTTPLGLEEVPRMPEVGLTTSDTTVSYDKHFDYSTNPIESSSIIVTPSTFDENFENFNNSAFEKYDELANNKIDEDSQQTDRLTTQQQETNAFNVTSLPFDTTVISKIARSSYSSTTRVPIERGKSMANLNSNNNSVPSKEDDLAENKIDPDSRYTTQEHQEIYTFNATGSPVGATTVISTIARSSYSSTTRVPIERGKSMANLNSNNNSVPSKEDDLAENKIDPDSRYTTQEHQEIYTFNATGSPVGATTVISTIARSSYSSTTRVPIERGKSMANLNSNNNSVPSKEDDLAENKIDPDSRYTTQEHQEIYTFNATGSPIGATTVISTMAMSPARSSTTRTIIEGDESWENSKVVASEESDPVNKHQGTKERVGYAKDGSSDHFRGAEVATVAAAAAVGGFVADKSSVAGAVVEEDAQPITSPVSESDTPVTPFGSDFSASRIRGYGTMNVSVAAAGIKESGTVVPTGIEIALARGRGDSPLVYTAMNSEDQESTAEYRGSANTNDPGMTDVKTTIEQSRVRTDRIRGNEVPGDDDSLGRQSVRLNDGSSSTHRSIQNPVHYRDEITRPSVPRKPKVDSEFSSPIVIPRIVASTTGSASNRPDPPGDNWSRTGPVRSKKRGSLNTDLQKTFRWFYNAEKGESSHSDQRGIRIECSENGHDHGKSVS